MEIWRIAEKFEYLYKLNSARDVDNIVSEKFEYISDNGGFMANVSNLMNVVREEFD